MKSKLSLFAVLVLGAAIAVFTVGAASASSPEFEYKTIVNTGVNTEAALNHAGKEGWELVGVALDTHTDLTSTTFYFKRRK